MKRTTLTIDNREVAFACNAATPIKYRAMTGRDYYRDIAVRMDPTTEDFDVRVMYDMAWVFAKTADPTLPDTSEEWLETFDEFDPLAVVTKIASAFAGEFKGTKKSKAGAKVKK